jgi:hypothetical protein
MSNTYISNYFDTDTEQPRKYLAFKNHEGPPEHTLGMATADGFGYPVTIANNLCAMLKSRLTRIIYYWSSSYQPPYYLFESALRIVQTSNYIPICTWLENGSLESMQSLGLQSYTLASCCCSG